jgi:hypothetical protein
MATSDSHSEIPEDPLDDCLKHARWPEPTGLERNRLEARWESLALARLYAWRRLMRWTLAASVLLALGLGVGGWLLLRPGEAEVLPQPKNVTSPSLADVPDVKQEAIENGQPFVRDATPYEELAFAVAANQRRTVIENRQAEPLIQVLASVLKEPEADVARLCQSLKTERATYESLILSRIAVWNRDEQRAALKVLKEIGSPRAIPVLDQLSRDQEFAKDAWPIALHLAPFALLGTWAKTGTSTQRKDAMQRLLSHKDDPKALAMLLHLVALPDSRKLAVSVIAADAHPPVEQLFAALKRGTKEQRHAAGLVLGQLKNPKVTKQLLAMAKEQAFPSEVMLGLLNSSDRDAFMFLKQANQHPQARTAVQLACLEWELISYASQFPHPLEIH